MNRIIIPALIVLTLAINLSVHGALTSPQTNVAPQDSTIEVVAWFNKNDTATYLVKQSSWKINETDTVMTSSVAMRVRLNVVDSTEAGYKMEYTFLEFPNDSLPDSAPASERLQHEITNRLAKRVVGTTVHFETDEFGQITKYNNLGQIKKQAKSLFNDAIKEFSKIPELQEMKKMGLDVTKYAKNIDTDKLVEGYLEELDLLFLRHGLAIKTGDFTVHEEATDSTYANTSSQSAHANPDGSYSLSYDITNFLPKSDIKAMVGSLVETLNDDSIKDSFDENFDDEVKSDGTIEEYLKINYLVNGLPYEVVRQNASMIGHSGKVKQLVITLETFSPGQ